MRRLQGGPEFLRIHKDVVIDFEYKLCIGTTGVHPFEEKGRLQCEIEISVVEILQDNVIVILRLSGDRFLETRETLSQSAVHSSAGHYVHSRVRVPPQHEHQFDSRIFSELPAPGFPRE